MWKKMQNFCKGPRACYEFDIIRFLTNRLLPHVEKHDL